MAVIAKRMTYQEFRQLEFDDNDPFLYELLNGELVKNLLLTLGINLYLRNYLLELMRMW